MRFRLKVVALILIFLITFSCGWIVGFRGYFIGIRESDGLRILAGDPAATTLDLSLFWQVLKELQSKYYFQEKIVAQKLLYGAISGMVNSLGDPYTVFFSPEQTKEYQKELSGIYEGIGAQLGFRESQLVIISPLRDSPAMKAGIKPGDEILAIDEESTAGISLPAAVSKIRGEVGTLVRLTLRHPESEKTETFEVAIKRAEIKVPSVALEWRSNQIAYLKVWRFGEDLKSSWQKAVNEILKQNAKGVVLDLRNNPGGYLEGSVYVASEFISSGTVVQKGLSSGRKEPMTIDHKGKLLTMPLVVLINQGSASAAEIVAGALQETNRAKLVGETTFGKGTIQEATDLSEGSSLHVTYARWLLPSGKSIDEEGLEPDVIIEINEDDLKAGQDPQLEEAMEILSNK